uniref:SMP-LTD domain-containing protein n=1 Tax=Nelumbo nucifera TaxID=4432 RepID=A0A822YTC2_NELNU|nr:TPA_asm: hypothetical protein HUJ06_006532 [Nelumbo nucifera]
MVTSILNSLLPSLTTSRAKRYPIKVESRDSVIYNGSKTFYVYLETSWEKEAWCKALRLAATSDKERVYWYAKLNAEFHDYLASLVAGYPSLIKPSIGFFGEPTDRANGLDSSSSKVRLFLKKLAKKASRSAIENKSSWTSLSVREERRIGEKSHSVQDLSLVSGLNAPSIDKSVNTSLEEDITLPLPSAFTHSGSQNQTSISEADSDKKFGVDEGTLCWNLLMFRLFFDAKRNADLKSFIQARIQRTLSSMRTPTYIGGVTCTGLDLGNLPPYIHNMRVLPMDIHEVWTMEIDIEYSGGATLDIETRLEVREPDFQKGILNTSLESDSVGEASSDLLEGFENFGNQLKLSEEADDKIERRDDVDDKFDGLRNSKSTSWTSNYKSRWKSILKSIANQVSQVPLSLAIRVASVRGTVRLFIKPPPSDQLWFGFTSMPDIDFNLDSSVGDHKITSGHVALLLGNRFKAAIRETLVLPNCESVCIPWMLADKNDWVPQKVAPFIWVNQEPVSESRICDAPSQLGDAKIQPESCRGNKQRPSDYPEEKHDKAATDVSVQQPNQKPSNESVSSSPSLTPSNSSNQSAGSQSLQDLRAPLSKNDEAQEIYNENGPNNPEYLPTSRSVAITEQTSFDEDVKPKRIGRRERMMGLGKKMGEKFEEKRRHIEEKGRHIVEKMRGP